MKRSPINRKTPLRRTGFKRRRRSMSTEQLAERAAVRDAVFNRDRTCQAANLENAGECYGPLTPHHRLKSSQGGGYTPENLVAMCAHHNDQLEADADLAAAARAVGLVVRSTDPEAKNLR